MKVYTKGGDKGRTSLIGGERVEKFDLRVEAYGTVDELTAYLANLYDLISEREALKGKMNQEKEELYIATERLMRLGAILAADIEYIDRLPQLSEEDVKALEAGIDRMSLRESGEFRFTLPMGDSLISQCHIVRTICRRAERCTIKSASEHKIPQSCKEYLNRLSDYLYMLTKELGRELDVAEVVWQTK